MILISNGKETIQFNIPKDNIIRCCGQCPLAINDASNPNDTPNKWSCTHIHFVEDQTILPHIFNGYKRGNYIPGCPIKDFMKEALRKKNKLIFKKNTP